MWEEIKKAAKQVASSAADRLEHRSFINSLTTIDDTEQGLRILKQKIDSMDDAKYENFCGTLAEMIGEAEQALHQAQNSSPWGTSFEDRLAYGIASFQSGESMKQDTSHQQMMVNGLNAIALLSQQFRQVRRTQEGISAHKAAAGSNTAKIEEMLDNLDKGGGIDPAAMADLMSMTDEASIDRITAKLNAMGGEVNKPMKIEDYYKPGTVKYEMKWPIAVPLPVPFDQLPHEMQFYVLFQEWSRRDLQGAQMLHSGDHAAAENIFRECLQRAEQLDVGELKARSYEALSRVANKMGNRDDARKWLKAALACREE